MREMKDSGIEWVGHIPFSWDVKPIRAKFREVTEKNKLGIEKNALKFTYGNIVKKENFDAADDDYVANTILNYMVVNPGTIMLNGLNLNFDFVTQRVALVKERGIITSAYIAFAPILDDDISTQFFTYLLKAYDSCKAFHNMGGGVRKILNFAELKKQYIVYPTITEQKRIANFLDAKCAEIDALTADIQTQIDTLEQYKRSVITEAVTKGLNPDVEMKDSGIEWIGKIPVSWSFPKITHILDYSHPYPIGDGDHGSIKSTEYKDEGIPFIRVQNLGFATELNLENIVYISESQNETIKNSSLFPGDVLFAKTGATIGKVGIVPKEIQIANTTSHVGKITVSRDINSKFVFYVLASYVGYKQFWDIAAQKSTRPELSIDEIKTIHVLLPQTIEEQIEIVAYLDAKCIQIDGAIQNKKEQVVTLDEYKKSLIYEYVTGKKEVPENA